eukprot:scaffold16830_cov32-Phaeocystis_antarctica.AAC.1
MTPFSASSRPLASCSCFFRSWISSSASAARERAGDRARYHSVTQLKAGAFQMFHRVCRVTERPRAPRIVPNRPRGCSLCLGAHGRFGGAVCAPFGGSGRSQALRISPRRTTYAKHGPQTSQCGGQCGQIVDFQVNTALDEGQSAGEVGNRALNLWGSKAKQAFTRVERF